MGSHSRRRSVCLDVQRLSSREKRGRSVAPPVISAAIAAAASAMLWCAPVSTRAADSSWTGPGGGVFNGMFQASVNWSAGVPAPADTATFDLAQTYRVSFIADVTNRAFLVGGGGNVTFGVPHSYTVSNATIGDNSALTLADFNLTLTGDGLKFGANSTLTVKSEVRSSDLQLATLDLPGDNARVNLQGNGTLRTGLIHVGNAANPPGSTLADVNVNGNFTIGSATARTDLIIERGGHILLHPTRMFVGKTLRVSGGVLDCGTTNLTAFAIDFAPDANMVIDQGGAADIQAVFNGASLLVHGAGNSLKFNGFVGSLGGSVVDIADGAFAQFGVANTIIPIARIGSSFATGRGELRFSSGATGLFGNLGIGIGGEGHLLVTGKGTVFSAASISSTLSIASSGTSVGTVDITDGGTLNARAINVQPTGTLTLDGGSLSVKDGGLFVDGGVLRMTNAASLVVSTTDSLTLSSGASAYFYGGTVSGHVRVQTGASLLIDATVSHHLDDADFSVSSGGTITANGLLFAKQIGITSGGLLNGNSTINLLTGLELDNSTIAGSGDIIVPGNFSSFGTSSARILDKRLLILNGGGFLSSDIEMAPGARIINSAGTLNANALVRLIGGRFDNQANYIFGGTGTTRYTAMFNNSGSVLLQRGGVGEVSLSFDGGGTHTGSFDLQFRTLTGDFRFGGGNHLFQSNSTVRATNVVFDGNVNATLLGTVTAIDQLSIAGAASVTAGLGARFDLAHAALTVSDNATFRIANPGFPPIAVGSLNVTDNGRLDLARGAAIVNDPASTPLARIATDVARGYHNGDWNGPGILSSDAAAAPSRYAVGYAQASTVLTADQTFFGQVVDPTDILIRFTLAGDATLDGEVDFNDLTKLAQNYNAPGDWSRGDFTYDGVVDFNDLVKLAQNYNGSLGISAPLPGASASFESDLARAFASVPEPSLLAPAAGFAFIALLNSRRLRPRRLRPLNETAR
jgi:hypothetical protein